VVGFFAAAIWMMGLLLRGCHLDDGVMSKRLAAQSLAPLSVAGRFGSVAGAFRISLVVACVLQSCARR